MKGAYSKVMPRLMGLPSWSSESTRTVFLQYIVPSFHKVLRLVTYGLKILDEIVDMCYSNVGDAIFFLSLKQSGVKD